MLAAAEDLDQVKRDQAEPSVHVAGLLDLLEEAVQQKNGSGATAAAKRVDEMSEAELDALLQGLPGQAN